MITPSKGQAIGRFESVIPIFLRLARQPRATIPWNYCAALFAPQSSMLQAATLITKCLQKPLIHSDPN